MRLRTIGLIVTLAVGILLAPLAAEAQQATKVWRIGYLGNTPPTTPEMSRVLGAFPQGLRDLGYVEGRNIAILRPGKQRPGVHPRELPRLVGRPAARDIPVGDGIGPGDWS